MPSAKAQKLIIAALLKRLILRVALVETRLFEMPCAEAQKQ